MKKIISFLSLLLLFAKGVLSAAPLSVVIIGGGPVGLATAIEAHENGAQVTIVEKRQEYSRLQTVFLLTSSLDLLKKWNVVSSQMHVVDLREGQQIGFVQIKNLEKSLEERVNQLGITKLCGEFKSLQADVPQIIVTTANNEEINLTYDLLVGADGPHSYLRDSLGIRSDRLGVARAVFIAIRHEDGSGAMDISPAMKKGIFFIRKISTPDVSIIFAQTCSNTSFPLEPISQWELGELSKQCEWQQEAQAIVEGKAKISDTFEIVLQQVQTFSNQQRSAILVGDAAAAASFFQGMGLNTGLKTAVIAGELIKKVQGEDKNHAYQLFNQKMKETTNYLIDDSRFLFVENK